MPVVLGRKRRVGEMDRPFSVFQFDAADRIVDQVLDILLWEGAPVLLKIVSAKVLFGP